MASEEEYPEHGGYTKEEYDITPLHWEIVGISHSGNVFRLLIRHVEGQICAAYGDWAELEELELTKIGRIRLLFQYDSGY